LRQNRQDLANEPGEDGKTTTMQSHASETTPASASVLHKRRNGQENNVPPSPVSHTGNARSRRPLALIGGAHDAAAAQPQQTSEVSADERATLLDELAAFAAAQPKAQRLDEAPSPRRAPPAHALASICAQPPREIVVERLDDASKLSERAARFRERVLSQGGDPDEDPYASATAKKRSRIQVGAAAYAQPVQPTRAGIPTYSKDPSKWVFYVHDDQIDHDRKALQKIDMGGGRSGLDALIDTANKVGVLFFNKFEIMVEEEVCSPMRLGALTKTSTTTLSKKALRIDEKARKREEGSHVAVFRQMATILRGELGVVAGPSGRVEGVFATFAVAGDYGGYDGHVTKMTGASSALHKGLIQAATLGRIDPIIEEGVNCNFARRTIESAKYGGIANAKRGNFRSNAQDGAPLVLAQVDPRQQRFGMRAWLTAGRLSTKAWGFVGVSGAKTNAAAEASGTVNIAFFSLADYDAKELALEGITSKTAPGVRPAAAAVEAFQDTLALCCEKQPHLFGFHEAMTALGLTDEPNTRKGSADKIMRKSFDAMRKWTTAESALSRAFSVGLGDGEKLLCTTKDFENIQEWEQDWSCARELLAYAGVECVSKLVHVSGDASGGAVIGDLRPHYVPLDTTMLDAHGERVHKPKRAKVGTGNGPTRFTCHRCGHAWNPDPEAIHRDGWSRCVCGTQAKPEA
jgi:hypothetical protein